ncbi:Prefoldin subunit-domain-containing protein [Panaeolus papilionaceus]|nr:Prefoldin subunit-domain-containing protein [Panaeolus papilionaceus]
MRMLEQEEENDDAAEVTWEKLTELKQEKEGLDDLASELELADEDEPVLYKVGDTFLHMSQPRALKRLEKDQAEIDSRVAELATQADDCETQMKQLKVVLYAKFGTAINLDE